MVPDEFGKLFKYQEFEPEGEFWDIRDVFKNFGEGAEVHVYRLNRKEEKYVVVDHQLSQVQVKALIAMYDLHAEGSEFGVDRSGSADIERLAMAWEVRESWRKVNGNEPDWEGFEDHMNSYKWDVWLDPTIWIDEEYQLFKEE